MARFASGDDQPREAMSWIGRWQTRKASAKPGRRLKADARGEARPAQSARVRDALAKTGVAGSLGVMSRRLGPSAVWQAARGEAAASRLCVTPLRAVQGRRSALKRHIGGQAKTSTGLYPHMGAGQPARRAQRRKQGRRSRVKTQSRACAGDRFGIAAARRRRGATAMRKYRTFLNDVANGSSRPPHVGARRLVTCGWSSIVAAPAAPFCSARQIRRNRCLDRPVNAQVTVTFLGFVTMSARLCRTWMPRNEAS